jgi:hypothetical protein
MSTTKEFPTGDVLSAMTGYLVSPNGMASVFEVLKWMTGEDIFTHQLPRIAREVAPVVLAVHPELASVCEEAKRVNVENWREWLGTWIARHGETISVPKLGLDQHERIDPRSELSERVHPDKIIVTTVRRPIP